jgi:hypothetical protein
MQWCSLSTLKAFPARIRRATKRQQETLAPYFRHGFWGRHKAFTGGVIVLIAALYGLVFSVTSTYFLVEMMIPVAVVAFFAIGLLPENGVSFRRTVGFLFFSFIAVLAVWPDYLALSLPGLPWVTAIRLIGIPLSLIFLVSLSQSKDARINVSRALTSSGASWKALLLFFIIAAVTLPLSETPVTSLNKYIVALYSWLAIFMIAMFIFQEPGRSRYFAQLIWSTSLVSCFIGLQEYRISQVPWAGHIPSFLKIEDPIIAKILSGVARAAIGEHRVQGKFTTPLSFAEFLALVAPFLIHFMVHGRHLIERVAAALTIPLITFVIITTDSRLGIIGLILSVLGYVFFWALHRWSSNRNSIIAPLIVVGYPAFSIIVLISSFTVGRLRNAIWGSGAYQASNISRQVQIEDGLGIVARQPWGHGLGRAAETLGHTDLDGFLTIDSYYLSVALEVGLVGFVAYYTSILWATWQGVKVSIHAVQEEDTGWLLPASLALVNFIVIKAVLSQQENHPLAFAILGLVVALTHRTKMSLIAAR